MSSAASSASHAETTPAPVLTTHPLLGVAGVLMGAMISTCAGRLLSVGLADLRGAMHLGVDEASWLGTAFNAAMMFIGPFSVYLGGLLGPRRVLLSSAVLFTVVSLLLPFAPNTSIMIPLLVLAGLSVGTFYPLTLSFVLRNLPMRYVLLGIAMYAIDIVFTTNGATALEAWYMDHFSWKWIFWNNAVLTPLMMILLYYGMPPQSLPKPQPGKPRPSWRGFLYASLAASFLYIALDQGQRLDWLHSGVIVSFATAGIFLAIAAFIRHFYLPNPLMNFRFLLRRNTILLSFILIGFRFIMLSTVVSIPNFLASVQGYRPLQTGAVLMWVAVPQFLLGLLAMRLMKDIDPRLILTAGFTLVAVACLFDARISSVWAGNSFATSQTLLALGLPLAFNAMVGSIVLELLNTGALSRPVDVLTFAGYFQTVRLLGGQIGTTFMLHFIPVREEFHSNVLGQGVSIGNSITAQRLYAFSAGLAPHSPGLFTATERAGQLLGLEVRKQAFTLAIADSFLLLATCCLVILLIVACMAKVPMQYRQVITANAKAKAA